MDEPYVGNYYNLQGKGKLKSNDSSSTSKTGVKKTPTTITSIEKSLEKDKDNGKNPTITK